MGCHARRCPADMALRMRKVIAIPRHLNRVPYRGDLPRVGVRVYQGGKRLGDETSSPLFKRCVMRRRTGTSALSALPVRLVAGKIYLSTNRKSHFLSLFFSQPCTMIKTFFHSPGSQLTMLMSASTLVNLFHS